MTNIPTVNQMSQKRINNQTRRQQLADTRTQLRMYRCLSPNIITKLFHDFDNGSQSYFVKRIRNKRRQDNRLDKSIYISSRISNNSSDIYVNYMKNNMRVMHFTIHMCPNNIYTPNAPLHAKQNSSKIKSGIILRVFQDETAPSKIRIELGSDLGQTMDELYRQETQIIVESLNEFFNEAAQNSSQQPLHRNAQKVYNNIQTSLKRHNKIKRRKTRRL